MMQNPFTYGNPISEPARFLGREREADQVFSRLRNNEFEFSSIVGDRRIGKTSLLNFIGHVDVGRRYGLDTPNYSFVYVDLRRIMKRAREKNDPAFGNLLTHLGDPADRLRPS